MKNVFLDSNVLFDALFARTPFDENAWQILNLGAEGKLNLSISTLTVVNAVYVAKKYGISLTDVRKSLKEMNNFISFIDLTENNIITQLDSDWKDFEDAVQHECALEHFADIIVTRNEKDFAKSSIPVANPNEFLKNFKG